MTWLIYSIVWEHQYDRRDVTWKRSITRYNKQLIGRDFHGLTELVPDPENKSQKKKAKKVGHVFRDKLLIVDTCRSVSV